MRCEGDSVEETGQRQKSLEDCIMNDWLSLVTKAQQ